MEEFVLLASGQRYRLLRSKSNRYKRSFVPRGINALFLTKNLSSTEQCRAEWMKENSNSVDNQDTKTDSRRRPDILQVYNKLYCLKLHQCTETVNLTGNWIIHNRAKNLGFCFVFSKYEKVYLISMHIQLNICQYNVSVAGQYRLIITAMWCINQALIYNCNTDIDPVTLYFSLSGSAGGLALLLPEYSPRRGRGQSRPVPAGVPLPWEGCHTLCERVSPNHKHTNTHTHTHTHTHALGHSLDPPPTHSCLLASQIFSGPDTLTH